MKRLATVLPLVFLFHAAPVLTAQAQNGAPAVATLVLHADQPGALIHSNIYGHFAEHLGHGIYGGLWVGPNSAIPNTRGIRNDVTAALKRLKIPVLRWPGGCFADEYHWKDGIGPRENRPKMINTHWGGVVEDNSFGTHEFMDLCEQLGCQAYVCGNVGSGSPQEMMEWVEYMTSDADTPMTQLRRQNGRDKPWKVAFFGVGNESWGCGGNMRPEYYSDLYRRFNTFIKDYAGSRIYRIASGANVDDYRWTTVLMSQVGRRMNGLSLHYYTVPSGDWGRKGSAINFDEEQWSQTLRATLRMETLITRHSEIMDATDSGKRVGLVVDEWGTWYDVEAGTNPGFLYQQSTLRDALVAALNFHIFHKHADRVVMANIAQMVNVLQSMVLTDGEKMLVTPTYWVFEMYKVHQGATFLPVELQTPDYQFGGASASLPMISASASRDKAGAVHLSLVNTDPNRAATVSCELRGLTAKPVSGTVLTGAAINSHNTFEAAETVHPQPFNGASMVDGKLSVAMPSKSVVVLELQ